MLTLFHPADGQVRAQGVTRCPNTVLHPWLKQELSAILATLPEPDAIREPELLWAAWTTWTAGLSHYPTLLVDPPAVRMLLILDNLKGHQSPELVLWLFRHGIVPLYTPLGGSWLNMAESIQRILKRRALEGQHPQTTTEIIAWLEAVAQSWNREPTPFVWGGKRAARRQRRRQRRYALGGSGACTDRPLRHRKGALEKWLQSCQVTH